MDWFTRAIRTARRKFDPQSGASVIVWARPSKSRHGRITGKCPHKKHHYYVEFQNDDGSKSMEEIHSRNMEKDWRTPS
jgi:hypothetical protein